MIAITVNNLSKYFDPPKRGKKRSMGPKGPQGMNSTIRAGDDVSFEVMKGEIFGFLGPNGAGKTTTIRMMTGVLNPTKGKIAIFGGDIGKNPIAIKQITGNVLEEANVYFELSGWQNLTLIGEIYGISKKDRMDQAEFLLKKFELYEKRNLKARAF